MKNITIPHYTIEELVEHSRNNLPQESCGILLGKDENITDVLIFENIATKINKINPYTCPYDNLQGFRFNEFRAWKAVEEAEEHGLICLGVWHSHPHLSTDLTHDDLAMMTDRRGKPVLPEAYYLIAGVTETDYKVCVWQWNDELNNFSNIYNCI